MSLLEKIKGPYDYVELRDRNGNCVVSPCWIMDVPKEYLKQKYKVVSINLVPEFRVGPLMSATLGPLMSITVEKRG